MRISDWSSDVCSYDLILAKPNGQVGFAHAGWTNEDHILTMVDEPEVQQRIDLSFGDGRLEIGRASWRKECVGTCRSRWSLYHSKQKFYTGIAFCDERVRMNV